MRSLSYISGLSLALVLSMGLSGCGGDDSTSTTTVTGVFADSI